MIIYLDSNFDPVEKENSVIAKVFPDDGSAPYFIIVKDKDKKENTDNG